MPDIFECYLSLPDEIYLHSSERPNELNKNAKGHGSRIEITEDGIFVLEDGFWRKGYPHRLHVLAANQVKRLIIDVFRLIRKAPILVLLLFPFRKILWNMFLDFGEMTFYVYYFKSQYYLKSGRILGQAITDVFHDERAGRIATYIWEYDDRYRYNFQIAFGLLDRQRFENNPKKEIRRVIDELIKRDFQDFVVKKWLAIKWATYLLPMKSVIKCISSIDWESMRMDDQDLHFARQIKEFNYEK